MTVTSITVTGVDGFVGRHLARAAKIQGLFVRGVSRSRTLPLELEQHLDEYYAADLTKGFPPQALSDAVIHLAGLAAVGPSFTEPQRYIEVNSAMVTHLCETILRDDRKLDIRLIAVSTGAVYGTPEDGNAISESNPIVLSSPYVVSKVLVENLVSYYQGRGIRSRIVRPFNHVGPGQGLGFLIPDLWERLTHLEPGHTLNVGNLETARDYLDVRDVVSAYLALALDPNFDNNLLNICSGTAVTGRQILNELVLSGGFLMPELELDATKIRPSDALLIAGSSQKLRSTITWEPKFSIRESIRDFVASKLAQPS